VTLALRDPRIPDSPLARWDPRWKLAAILFLAAAAAAARHPAPAAAALVVALVLTRLGRLPARRVAERLGLLALAVVPFLLVLPFTLDPAGPGWDVGPVRASEKGVMAGLGVVFRCLAVGTLAVVLVGTAPLPRTLAAAHALKVPGVLVQVAQLAYRYAFLLFAEARRVRMAIRARGFRPRTNAHTYRTLGRAAGAVLVRGGDRAEAVAAAMTARGFDGTYRALIPFHTTTGDVRGFAAAVAAAAGLVAWDWFLQY
jgi:cobalt/nickel transport system permease protein